MSHRDHVEAAVASLVDSTNSTLFGRSYDLSQAESRDECIGWLTRIVCHVNADVFSDAGCLEQARKELVTHQSTDARVTNPLQRGIAWFGVRPSVG